MWILEFLIIFYNLTDSLISIFASHNVIIPTQIGERSPKWRINDKRSSIFDELENDLRRIVEKLHRIENGSAEDKAAGVKEIKPRQPTGDDVYKDIRVALDKSRGGPIKTFLYEKGNPIEDSELQ